MAIHYTLVGGHVFKSKSLLLFFLIWAIPIGVFAIHFCNFSNFISTLINEATLKMTLFTLYQAGLSTLIALGIAILPAIYVSFNQNFLTKLLKSTLFIPFFFPVISATTTFILIGHFPIFQNLNFLFSLKAIIVANVFFNAPIFIYYIGETLSKTPRTLQDLAHIDGTTQTLFFRKILLPLATPSLFRAAILCFAYSFTNFAIILNLGGLKFSTLEVSIATTLLASYNFSTAFTYGILQLFILSLIFLLLPKPNGIELELEQKIMLKTPLYIWVVSIIFCIFEFSIVVLSLLLAFFNFYTNSFSIMPLLSLFSSNLNSQYPVILSFIISLILSFIAALLVIVLVYFLIKTRNRYTHFLLFSTLGISNAFLSICLIYLNVLYSIPVSPLLLMGYIIIATPIAYAFLSPHFETFPQNIIESASLSVASRWQTFFYIEWPLLKPLFMSTLLQIFTIIFGEFTLTYTMQIYSELPTLPITGYILSSGHNLSGASALSGLSIIFIVCVYFISLHISNRKNY